MDSQSNEADYSFSIRTRNENNRNDLETVRFLRKEIEDQFGINYLNKFLKLYPYCPEKNEEKVVKQPVKHFTSFASTSRAPPSDYKREINSTIFGIYSDPNVPGLDETCAFRVVYGIHKPGKKHKQWTDDGFILIENRNLTIYDENGKILCGSRPVTFSRYVEGEQFIIGSREYEISSRIEVDDIKMGNFANPRAY